MCEMCVSDSDRAERLPAAFLTLMQADHTCTLATCSEHTVMSRYGDSRLSEHRHRLARYPGPFRDLRSNSLVFHPSKEMIHGRDNVVNCPIKRNALLVQESGS